MSHGSKDERPACRTVAANMRLLRRRYGWDQAELGQKLGGWSNASVSAAERSVGSKRVRIFDIDEVVQLAAVFGVTVADMLAPVPPCPCCQGKPPQGMKCQACGAAGAPFGPRGDAAPGSGP